MRFACKLCTSVIPRPRRWRCLLFGICALTLTIIVLTSVFVLTSRSRVLVAPYRSRTRNASSDMVCDIPLLDPFDPSILNYVKPPTSPLDCTVFVLSARPIIFSTSTGGGGLLVQLEDPSQHNLWDCCYKPFSRLNESDVKISDTCYPIKDWLTPIRPQHEFIIVYCSPGGLFGWRRASWIPSTWTWIRKREPIDMFNFVHLKKPRPKEKRKNPINLVMIGQDSMSHMNFIRTMPRTYSYLQQNVSTTTADVIGLNGYIKVGDNTYPNLMAMLAGISEDEAEAGDGCWGSVDWTYFDGCPFIWKNFSELGYVTSFSEDASRMAIFNFYKSGFEAQPTDFYLRPFMSTFEDLLGHVQETPINTLCCGPRLGFKILLQHLAKMAVATRAGGQNYFAFTWATALSHDRLNMPHHGDQLLVDFLKWFENFGANTIIILLSDHGMRIGDIRTTWQGRIEERMPFFYFLFPKWFTAKYSTAIQNLRTNSERLTTPFDVHETLLDLLDPENSISNAALRTHRHGKLMIRRNPDLPLPLPRGISLFTTIPASRTCADAAVEPHWCICDSMQGIPDPVNDARVINAVRAVVSTLNILLADYHRCAELRLRDPSDILSAQEFIQPNLLSPNEEEGTAPVPKPPPRSSFSSKLTVTFKVSPSDAVFEATVTQVDKTPGSGTGTQKHWVVAGEISRLNLYGTQSSCVDNYKLKKYCYCL